MVAILVTSVFFVSNMNVASWKIIGYPAMCDDNSLGLGCIYSKCPTEQEVNPRYTPGFVPTRLRNQQTKPWRPKTQTLTTILKPARNQSKWHHREFVLAIVSTKGCVFDVCLSHTYLVVPRSEIQLRENTSTDQYMESGIYQELWHDSLHDLHKNAMFCLFFSNKQNRTRERTSTRLYNPRLQHLCHLFCHFFFLRMWVSIGSNTYRSCPRKQMYHVFESSKRWQSRWFLKNRSKKF